MRKLCSYVIIKLCYIAFLCFKSTRRRNVFKKLDNGKYRYYEKFYHEREGKWKQVSVTLKSKSRVSQAEAKRRLALKIEKLLTAPTKEEVEKKQLEEMIFSQLLEEWKMIRSSEIKSSSYRSEMKSLELFMGAVGNLRISDYTTQLVQTYLMNLNVQNSTRKIEKYTCMVSLIML